MVQVPRKPTLTLVIGGRLVSATENALINTLELPLAVAWVWVCFAEVPTITSLVGGIIVMAAVAGHVWHSSRSLAATE
jgi:drug/metabolite transporter (DMT)-like permease